MPSPRKRVRKTPAVTRRKVGRYVVEDGVPMPAERSRYPWPSMRVGSSVHFATRGYYAIHYARKWAREHKNGWKFTLRQEPGCGHRIWRTK